MPNVGEEELRRPEKMKGGPEDAKNRRGGERRPNAGKEVQISPKGRKPAQRRQEKLKGGPEKAKRWRGGPEKARESERRRREGKRN